MKFWLRGWGSSGPIDPPVDAQAENIRSYWPERSGLGAGMFWQAFIPLFVS